MKIIKNKIINFAQSVGSSYWHFAFWNVLSQWAIGIVLGAIGAWMLQTIFSISLCSIIALVPDAIYSFFCSKVQVICGIVIIIISVQVYVKHKWYKIWHLMSEVPYSENLTHVEKLNKCDLGINSCESYKEVLSVEKDFIKSFSPLPIVTAILGYVLEMLGIKNFNWQVFVIICIGMIMMYVFLCINNVRKFRDNKLLADKWREVKLRIMAMEKCS